MLKLLLGLLRILLRLGAESGGQRELGFFRDCLRLRGLRGLCSRNPFLGLCRLSDVVGAVRVLLTVDLVADEPGLAGAIHDSEDDD